MNDDPYALLRERMVATQIEDRGVRDPRLLDVMRQIPRHLFVPPAFREAAYQDRPLPIGSGQTISQPYIVAVMTELLHLKENDRVLEIGTGSGYQAAILSRLAKTVVTMERLPGIAEDARRLFESLGYTNITVVSGDGTEGYGPGSPYDGIIVTAATPDIPGPLVAQLGEGGRLVAPVGSRDLQQLVRLTRRGGSLIREEFGGVVFVPLLGKYGWKD
ncbi:MAG TPA: protein-L-isoaspartate(D-aspartate) O-methyltransferase [Methanoregulaceae archaeon]|nr:protein-L-isoaspartate(D-aspartate) O-methyltransferase [Methanoregulaceae archaeon]